MLAMPGCHVAEGGAVRTGTHAGEKVGRRSGLGGRNIAVQAAREGAAMLHRPARS